MIEGVGTSFLCEVPQFDVLEVLEFVEGECGGSGDDVVAYGAIIVEIIKLGLLLFSFPAFGVSFLLTLQAQQFSLLGGDPVGFLGGLKIGLELLSPGFLPGVVADGPSVV